jgi:hypothetical protein
MEHLVTSTLVFSGSWTSSPNLGGCPRLEIQAAESCHRMAPGVMKGHPVLELLVPFKMRCICAGSESWQLGSNSALVVPLPLLSTLS